MAAENLAGVATRDDSMRIATIEEEDRSVDSTTDSGKGWNTYQDPD